MRTGTWIAILTFCLGSLIGCGGGSTPSLPHLYAADGGQVQGYVSATPTGLALTGARGAAPVPVSGAQASILGWGNASVSDASGHFDLANLPEGDYTLRVAHPQFRDILVQPVHVTKGRSTLVSDSLGVGYYIGVGINDYLNLNDLGGPRNDLAAMDKNLFTFYGIRTLLTDGAATKEAIHGAFTKAAAVMNADDYLIFYYSGHGGSDTLSDGTHIDFICPADSLLTSYHNDISDTELHDWIALLPDLSRVVVILDTCYSGAFFDGSDSNVSQALTAGTRSFAGPATFRALSKSGCTVMASSASTELTWESGGSGVFTHFLTEGLSLYKRNVDTDQDHQITVRELFDYAAPKTTQFIATQHPTLQVGQNPVLARY